MSDEPGVAFHYFDREVADPSDWALAAAVRQGYVPPSCLLAGRVVLAEVGAGRDPCAGCEGPRERCGGRDRSGEAKSPQELAQARPLPDWWPRGPVGRIRRPLPFNLPRVDL